MAPHTWNPSIRGVEARGDLESKASLDHLANSWLPSKLKKGKGGFGCL